jgi:hypothetical protein
MPNVLSAWRDRAAAQDYRTGATFLHAAARGAIVGDDQALRGPEPLHQGLF